MTGHDIVLVRSNLMYIIHPCAGGFDKDREPPLGEAGEAPDISGGLSGLRYLPSREAGQRQRSAVSLLWGPLAETEGHSPRD